ncbi:MAG: hypothetical protein ACLP1X_18620 [Polyangiaceae bacterium]
MNESKKPDEARTATAPRLSEYERAQLELERRGVEAQEESVRVASLMVGTQAFVAEKRNATAIEEHEAFWSAKGPEGRYRLSIPVDLVDLGGEFGCVTSIEVTAIAFAVAPSEKPRTGDRLPIVNKHRINGLCEWRTDEAVATIRATLRASVAATIAELERKGEATKVAELLEKLERPSTGVPGAIHGVKGETWRRITLTTLRKCVGRLVEDLVAVGAVTLVDAKAAAQ